ncbi:MAG: hypothetical protein Q7U13_08935 [Rhodoferax sp.]|nr:hypothetical protein [Rhodoferax sp.]
MARIPAVADVDVLIGLRAGIGFMRDGMMSSLEPEEQKEFMRLLRKFVHLNDRQDQLATRKTKTGVVTPTKG